MQGGAEARAGPAGGGGSFAPTCTCRGRGSSTSLRWWCRCPPRTAGTLHTRPVLMSAGEQWHKGGELEGHARGEGKGGREGRRKARQGRRVCRAGASCSATTVDIRICGRPGPPTLRHRNGSTLIIAINTRSRPPRICIAKALFYAVTGTLASSVRIILVIVVVIVIIVINIFSVRLMNSGFVISNVSISMVLKDLSSIILLLTL